MAVGAGGALTVGENELPPDGLIDFSVGATVGADDPGAELAGAEVGAGEAGAEVGVVVAVVVVADVDGAVVSGACLLCPQALSVPMETSAAIPAVAAIRRADRPELMVRSSLGRITELYRPQIVVVNA